METTYFELSLKPNDSNKRALSTIYANQYDEGRRFTATIYDVDGTVYNFTDETVTLVGTKPSGTGFSYTATASGNTVTFDTTGQMTVVSGVVRCGFIITKGDVQVGTIAFYMYVQKAALQSETIIDSDDFGSIITDAVVDWMDEHGSPIDTTLSVSGSAADAKATGDAIAAETAAREAADAELKSEIDDEPYLFSISRTANLFDLRNARPYSRVRSTGIVEDVSVDNFWTTGYIPIAGGSTVYLNYYASAVAFYDSSKNFIPNSYSDAWTDIYVIPSNAEFAIFEVNKTRLPYEDKHLLMISISQISSFDGYYKINGIPKDLTAELAYTQEKEPLLLNAQRTSNDFNFMFAESPAKLVIADGTVDYNVNAIFWITGFVPVTASGTVRLSVYALGAAFYDSNKVFISFADSSTDVYTVPSTASYARFQFNNNFLHFDNRHQLMISMSAITSFESYYSLGVEGFDEIKEDVGYLVGTDYGISRDVLLEEAKDKNLVSTKKAGILSFPFLTDVHDHPTYKRAYKYNILNMLGRMGTYDFICCGGDMLNYETKDELIENISEYNRLMTQGVQVPCFVLKGNHDASGEDVSAQDTSNILTDNEWYKLACSALDNECKMNPLEPYGGYYYRDFEKSKIRVIFMNTSQINGLGEYLNPLNVIIKQDQVDWLCDYALNFADKGADKTNWGVIILSHASVNVAEAGNSIGAQSRVIEHILYAFMNGTSYSGSDGTGIYEISADVDFTSQGEMEFICNICGHAHYDRVTTFSTLNRPCITVGSGMPDQSTPSAEGATNPTRTPNTITMELLDIISIDTVGRKIYCTRYGAGNDREVSY